MSSFEGRHPSKEHLLSLLDGELPPRETGAVRSHLEACWQCRSEVEELEKTIARCVDYRKDVLEELLPAPPRPWADLYARMDAVDGEAAAGGWFDRVFRMPRWVPVAVALALSVGVYQRLSLAPMAQAAVVLRKAVSAAETRKDTPRRIQIRTRTQKLVRSLPVAVQPVVSDPETAALAARFEAARYDWNDPLSARAFENWRDQLPSKSDEVTDANGRVRIHTTTEAGEMTEATLALRAGDLAPVEGTFRFRDDELVEITELPAAPVAPVRETAVAPSAVRETPAAAEPAPPQPAPETTVALELRVVAALQRAGADLGESIEIHRSAGRIEVRGAGIDPDRRQKIKEALASLPLVEVRFTDTAPGDRVVERTQAVSGNVDTALQSELEQRAGGRVRLEQISSAALDLNESLMARAFALRRMAERFPAAAEIQLGDSDRASMTALLQEHAFVLRAKAAELETSLAPLVGTPATPGMPATPSSWQAATADLFRAARRTEVLLAALLGGAATDVTSADLPGQLSASIGELKGKAEAYQRILDNSRN